MNATAPSPVAPPAIAAPVPGAASPAENPPAAAPAAAPAALSTASLSASIVSQLTGAKPATPPASGQEPSPPAGSSNDPSNANPAPAPAPAEPATPPSPDDDDDDEPSPPAAFPPEAVAALATQRKKRKELKNELKTVKDELGALKTVLAQVVRPGEPPKGGTPNEDPADASDRSAVVVASPELAKAQELVTSQEELRNWSRKEQRALQHAIENETDTTAMLANLQAQVTKFGVTLPAEPEGVLAWLDKVRTDAEDKLADAKLDVRDLRRDLERQHSTLRSEGETFARTVAPKMFEAGTEEHQRFTIIKQKIPGIERHPLGFRFITAAVRGWEIIKGELEAKAPNGQPNGAPAKAGTPNGPPALPPKPAPALPGAPAQVPQRPQEGAESSSAIYARYKASLANPQATEQERDALKQQWMRANLAGR